jgi:putative cell wall-binding protein
MGVVMAALHRSPGDARGRRRRRVWLAVIFAVLLVAVGAVGVVPMNRAAARPIEENFSITVAGAFGDMLFTPSNSWIGVNQSNQIDQQVLQITVQGFDDMPQMFLDFSSRAGSKQYLQVGHYPYAQRYPFMDPGRPGISLSPLGFCHTQTGNFEVRDIAWDGPAITRIWITYQRYCNSAQPADVQPAFGEVRLGYPKTSHDVSPQVIRWPDEVYPDGASYDVPVWVRRMPSVAVEVTSVSLTGRHASDFPVRQNGCTGALSSTGCVIVIGFTPHGPGPRHATLRVVTTAGTTDVSLDGAGPVGRSDWILDVDHEDPSMADEHLELPISLSWGGPYEFASGAYGDEGIVWRAFFDLPGAATFSEGHYAWSPDGTGLVMSLARGNQGCEIDRASIDIAELAFTGPDKQIARLDLTMDVHCRASYGQTIRGRVRFHDRDDLTAPGEVTDVSAVRDGGDVTLRWTNPAAADLAGVVVRWYPDRIAPSAPDVGNAVYFGTGNTVRFEAPSARPIAVAISTYDQTGNVGGRRELVVEPLTTSPPRAPSTPRPEIAERLDQLASDSVTRIQGADRIATAIDASQFLFGSATDPAAAAGAVVLARSDLFPDALAGVPLAAASLGPLLTTPPTGLDSQVATEIVRTLPKDRPVYLLGGTGALSQGVEDAVRALGYTNVVRLQGANRFLTALAIAQQVERVLAPDPLPLVLIATGRNFPDALGAGAAAGAVGGVVVLSDGETLPQPVLDYVAQKQQAGAFVATVGGPAAPSYPAADQAIVGADRYATAASVAGTFFVGPTGVGPLTAGLATGTNFPDALSGGAFMGLVGGPMLLTQSTALNANAGAFLGRHRTTIDFAFIFGGAGAVSNTVDGQVAAAIAG